MPFQPFLSLPKQNKNRHWLWSACSLPKCRIPTCQTVENYFAIHTELHAVALAAALLPELAHVAVVDSAPGPCRAGTTSRWTPNPEYADRECSAMRGCASEGGIEVLRDSSALEMRRMADGRCAIGVVSPSGAVTVRAGAVVLATGSREREQGALNMAGEPSFWRIYCRKRAELRQSAGMFAGASCGRTRVW